jgi:hypothetical protein
MSKEKIYSAFAALGVCFAVYASTPMTTSPDAVEIDVAKGEKCVKETGRLKCRWGGDCVQVGNQCMSCMEGQHYSSDLGQCYSCESGTSLAKENGSWVCK